MLLFLCAGVLCVHVLPNVCLAGGEVIPLQSLTVDQVALLLEGLDLGDYVTTFGAAGVNGDTLQFCHTREELKEEKDVDMTSARFRKLRAAVEKYAPSGVPTALLEEARGRVQQREREEAEEARRRAEAQAAEEARRRAEREAAERQVAQQREREANLLRLKAEAPRKVLVL